MKLSSWRPIAIVSCVVLLIAAFAGVPGCPSVTETAQLSLPETSIDLPEDGPTLLVIEDDGLGPTSFYGTEADNGSDPTFFGFETYVDDDRYVVRLDEQERPEIVVLGLMVIMYDYNLDGTFNYELADNGELIYSGSGIVPDQIDLDDLDAAKPIEQRIMAMDAATTFADCMDMTMSVLFIPFNNYDPSSQAVLDCVKRDAQIVSQLSSFCVLKQIREKLREPTSLCERHCFTSIFQIECQNACERRCSLAYKRLGTYLVLQAATIMDTMRQINDYYETNGRCQDDKAVDDSDDETSDTEIENDQVDVCTVADVAGTWTISWDSDCDGIEDYKEINTFNTDKTVSSEEGFVWNDQGWNVGDDNTFTMWWTGLSTFHQASIAGDCNQMVDGRHTTYSEVGAITSTSCWTADK